MKEKVLIQSERYNIKKMLRLSIILAIVVALVGYVWEFADSYALYHDWNDGSYSSIWVEEYNSAFEFALDWTSIYDMGVIIGLASAAVILVVGFVAYFWLSKIELIVSDKRVYGTAAFGKRVDLPLDSVSAIGTGWPKGIAVATSSGKISFLAIKNCGDIHKVLSNLLIERQNRVSTPIQQGVSQSSADELKQFKELLDSGVITREEFDAKKKELLNL